MKSCDLIEILNRCPENTPVLFEKDGIKYEIHGYSYEEKMILLKNG
jgi:hypothetical protein